MKFDTNKTNSRVLDTMVPVREPQTVVELANFLQSGLNTTPTRARGRRVPVTLGDVATARARGVPRYRAHPYDWGGPPMARQRCRASGSTSATRAKSDEISRLARENRSTSGEAEKYTACSGATKERHAANIGLCSVDSARVPIFGDSPSMNARYKVNRTPRAVWWRGAPNGECQFTSRERPSEE